MEILLVDDTPENLSVLGNLLREQHYTVRIAVSGALALRSVLARRPDLILLDIRMPEMDGFETCRRLRSDPAMIGLPIIFLSASDAPDDRIASFAAGGHDFISKPFQAAEVLARVNTHLTLARTRQELDRINERLAQQVTVEGWLREAAETTSKDRQIRLDLTLAAANLGIWEVDRSDGGVTFDTRAHAILDLPTGYRPNWREFLRLIPEAVQDGITQRWERSKRQQGVYEVDGWWTLPGSDRGRRRIRMRGRRLPAAEGHSSEMVGVIWDTTDEHLQRERLAQRDRLESIGLLAGGVAHDFNNQLAVIVGELDILELNSEIPSIARPHLANIGQAADASTALIRDLLSFARRRELLRAPLDLAALIRRASHLAGRSMGTIIHTEVTVSAESLWVIGDASQLENAILNLCINARDAMPGGGTLTISVAREDIPGTICQISQEVITGPWIVIRITDTGSGIPEDLRQRIFEPFFTTKPEGQGNGLGLPSVIGCVAAHAGHLTMDSTVGVGTSFGIMLPPCEAPVVSQPTVHRPGVKTGELLLLDDQESVREVIAEGLRLLGWKVHVFSDPDTAIAAWHDHRPRFSLALVGHGHAQNERPGGIPRPAGSGS